MNHVLVGKGEEMITKRYDLSGNVNGLEVWVLDHVMLRPDTSLDDINKFIKIESMYKEREY